MKHSVVQKYGSTESRRTLRYHSKHSKHCIGMKCWRNRCINGWWMNGWNGMRNIPFQYINVYSRWNRNIWWMNPGEILMCQFTRVGLRGVYRSSYSDCSLYIPFSPFTHFKTFKGAFVSQKIDGGGPSLKTPLERGEYLRKKGVLFYKTLIVLIV